MPRVPLLKAHSVVIEFLVEILKQRYGLDNHRVNLVTREGKLVSRHRVGQTELHLLELRLVFNAANQRLHLEPNAAHDLVCFVTSLAIYAKLFSNGLAKLLLGNEEFILNALLNNVFV